MSHAVASGKVPAHGRVGGGGLGMRRDGVGLWGGGERGEGGEPTLFECMSIRAYQRELT